MPVIAKIVKANVFIFKMLLIEKTPADKKNVTLPIKPSAPVTIKRIISENEILSMNFFCCKYNSLKMILPNPC